MSRYIECSNELGAKQSPIQFSALFAVLLLCLSACAQRVGFLEDGGPVHAAGDIDSSFGDGGTVVLHMIPYSIAQLPNGRIMIGGGVARSPGVMELSADGQLYTAFGDAGSITGVTVGDPIWVLVPQSDGAVLLGQDLGVDRMSDTGVLEGGWNAVVTSWLVPEREGRWVGVQKQCLACSALTVMRYLDDGGVDSSFGQNGTASISNGPVVSVAVPLTGDVVVTEEDYSDATRIELDALNPAGNVDAEFGDAGHFEFSMPVSGGVPLFGDFNHGPVALTVADNSDIIVFGNSAENSPVTDHDFAVARVNRAGQLDGAFGVAGIASVDFGHTRDEIQGGMVDSSGRIIALGSVSDGGATSWGIARFLMNGELDVSFATNGKLIATDAGTTFTGSIDEGSAAAKLVIEQSDGKLVVLGYEGSHWLVQRFWP